MLHIQNIFFNKTLLVKDTNKEYFLMMPFLS